LLFLACTGSATAADTPTASFNASFSSDADSLPTPC
jgi:hypothetical protein